MFHDAGYRASPNATGRMFCGRRLISPHPVAAHHATSSSATLNSRRPRFSRGLPRPEVRGLRHSRGQDGSADVRILNAIPTEKKPPALTAQTAASQQTLNFNSRPPPEQPPPDSFAASLLARSSAETGSSGKTLVLHLFFLASFTRGTEERELLLRKRAAALREGTPWCKAEPGKPKLADGGIGLKQPRKMSGGKKRTYRTRRESRLGSRFGSKTAVKLFLRKKL